MKKYPITTFETYGREPILRRMKDGTLVCLFLTGGRTEPMNENVVMIARSHDSGETWSKPEVLFSHSSRACWSTELFTDCEKPFAVVQTYFAPCQYRELQTFRSFCDDSGENWTEPVSFKGSINGCSIRQGFRLSNGEIFFPLYWQETQTGFDWEHKDSGWDMVRWPFISGAGISSDGELFTRYGYIEADVALWEPNAVEVENGHIIMYCRSCKGFLYTSESFDYGRTWSKAELSDLPNPDSKLTLLKVRGKILLIENWISNGRTNLCILASDDGKHFTKLLNLEDEAERYFYPHAFAEESEEMLYVAYENAKQHYLAKIPYAELGL